MSCFVFKKYIGNVIESPLPVKSAISSKFCSAAEQNGGEIKWEMSQLTIFSCILSTFFFFFFSKVVVNLCLLRSVIEV